MSESNTRAGRRRADEPVSSRRSAVGVAALTAYATAAEVRDPQLSVAVGAPTERSLPELGFHIGRIAPLPDQALDRIRSLGPSHVRVDVRLGADGWERDLSSAFGLARRIGCHIELGVRWDGGLDGGAVSDLVQSVPGGGILRRVLVLGSGAAIARRGDRQLVRDLVRARFPDVDVFASAGGDFVILNRGWEEIGGADGVSYAIKAQVHASDDLSVIESLDGQEATVITAVAKGGGLPVAVSSVSLGAGGPDDAPDPRQPSLFGACWVLGSISALAGAGARSVTYRGLVGAAGLIDGGSANDLGDRRAGGLVFPAYHVFADLADLAGVPSVRMLATTTTGDLPSAVLGVASDRRVRLLVGNLSSRAVHAAISGLRPGPVTQRVLGSSTASDACRDPERFRSASVERLTINGQITIDLEPFAIATISQHRG